MIDVEDRTKPLTVEQLAEAFEIFTGETRKALVALSNNDQIIIEQTKTALEEVTSKVLYLSARLELFVDLFEKLVIGQEECIKKLPVNQYKELVEEIKFQSQK